MANILQLRSDNARGCTTATPSVGDSYRGCSAGFDGQRSRCDHAGQLGIAELFQQKLNTKKQVITLQDVEEIISIMGHPSDFDHDSEEEAAAPRMHKSSQRRLYRNPDDRLLGGVCSGLGAYFNIDTVWVRVLFILATWVGVSILVYIILWVIIPSARTVAEKLEMQGDPVTIANIEKSIREEVSEIKDKLEDLTEQAKQTFRKKP